MKRVIATIGMLVGAAAYSQSPKSLRPNDFAYGLEIQTGADASVYELELPLQLYQRMARADMGDMRVFNAAGEIVPYSLRFKQAAVQQETRFTQLPLFPLRGDVSKATEDLQIRVLAKGQEQAREVVVSSQPSADRAQATRPIVAYLIDARSINESMSALQLSWQDSVAQFNVNAQIDASDDLRAWQTVIQSSPVLQLQYSGHALLEQHVDLPGVQSKYLRLTFHGTMPVELESVQVEQTRSTATRNWQVTEISATQLDVENKSAKELSNENNKNAYQFQLPIALPIREINILLPQPNTVVAASFLSRQHDKQPWQLQMGTTLYRLKNGDAETHNRSFVFPSQSQHWLMQVNADGGGLGAGMPTMQISWEPHKLLFVARGAGPFLLAYGNAAVTSSESPIDMLMRPAHTDATQTELTAVQAQWGKSLELGGAAVLKPVGQKPWKTWLLWAGLIIAVALLAWMAKRLMNEMSADSNKQ
jgi:hypothetical protein